MRVSGVSPSTNAISTPQLSGVNKALFVTVLAVAVLAMIPAAYGSVDIEAYKTCMKTCEMLSGADRGYDACINNCRGMFLNYYYDYN